MVYYNTVTVVMNKFIPVSSIVLNHIKTSKLTVSNYYYMVRMLLLLSNKLLL